ncbi:hypothetical protein AWB74_06329 [Caballeronia arvi]|uniref:Uncharacterized protein n=1 Tax=Caballeronia arvi TaxID=1777135 RepID=A0A158KNB0_9BURK|nr:hypothetical protein [Caballeronia arvi]SAL82622.1 hypothetical protein AWB74_06329 [Caballeronia arvi]
MRHVVRTVVASLIIGLWALCAAPTASSFNWGALSKGAGSAETRYGARELERLPANGKGLLEREAETGTLKLWALGRPIQLDDKLLSTDAEAAFKLAPVSRRTRYVEPRDDGSFQVVTRDNGAFQAQTLFNRDLEEWLAQSPVGVDGSLTLIDGRLFAQTKTVVPEGSAWLINDKRLAYLTKEADGALSVEMRSGLRIPVESQIDDLVAVEQMLQGSMSAGDVVYVAAFGRRDSGRIREISRATQDKALPINNFLDKSGELKFGKVSNKTVVVVGHIDEAEYLLRGTGKEADVRVSMAKLKAAATLNGNKLITLGCSSFCASGASGYKNTVYNPDVAQSLGTASRKTELGQFLSALATKDSPLYISGAEIKGLLHTLKISPKARPKDAPITTERPREVARVTRKTPQRESRPPGGITEVEVSSREAFAPRPRSLTTKTAMALLERKGLHGAVVALETAFPAAKTDEPQKRRPVNDGAPWRPIAVFLGVVLFNLFGLGAMWWMKQRQNDY